MVPHDIYGSRTPKSTRTRDVGRGQDRGRTAASAVALVATGLGLTALFAGLASEPEKRGTMADPGATRVEPEAASRVASSRRAGPSRSPVRGGGNGAAIASSPGQIVAEAAWGDGPADLGRRGGSESSPEGPMSFDVDGQGRTVVLDQVNGRLQRFEGGAAVGAVALPRDTYQDMALGEDGRVALLDRFGESAVTILDDAGNVVAEVPLEGRGVPDGGSVTGLFQRDDGTWVEVGHQRLVRIAKADGQPDPDRPMANGRFAADGSGLLRVARSGSFGAVVTREGDRGAAEPLAAVRFELPVHHLTALDSDPAGRVLLGASLAEEDTVAPFDVVDEAEAIVLLDGSGSEIRRWLLPASSGPEETFRAIRFGRDGAIYRMQLTALGVVVRRFAA